MCVFHWVLNSFFFRRENKLRCHFDQFIGFHVCLSSSSRSPLAPDLPNELRAVRVVREVEMDSAVNAAGAEGVRSSMSAPLKSRKSRSSGRLILPARWSLSTRFVYPAKLQELSKTSTLSSGRRFGQSRSWFSWTRASWISH